jgi:1-deoxy-D-xylulose-5-phosphate reductoisomerase
MKKLISILGSTGSVGLSTLSIIEKEKNLFKINLLSANKNYNLISAQIKKYKPNLFIINNNEIFKKVKVKFKKHKTKIINNFKNLNLKKSDITISAIPGIAGLKPTIILIKSSKKILIANKESIICGWNLVKREAHNNKTKIIPIDSEHFSILKLLQNQKLNEIKKIYITASGGPFLNFKKKQFKNIKPKQALKHPTWKMGKKISIDSSTLMNKIFELVEAQKLFNLPSNKLDILIHPESLVHAIVELKNGLIKFIYHETSMIVPIANAIFDKNLDIKKFYKKKENFNHGIVIKNLTFKKVDSQTFPIIKIKNYANKHPSSSIIINAANEILVDHFLAKKISFLSIYKNIFAVMNDRNFKKYAIKKPNNIIQIEKIDSWARTITLKKIC